ncbi:MAG: DMT family transporter [Spirochaetales bacterium]|nr:DMT family transporter [Spirochaetales bacterium]
MNSKNLAVPAIILAAAIGASSGLYIKSLPFSSLAMTGFRMGLPFLFFLPLMIKRKLVLGGPEDRKMILLGSSLNGLRMFLYVFSYKLTTLTNAVVLLYLWPIFALLLDCFLNKKKLKLREFLILFMALSGVVLLNVQKGFSLSRSDLLGSLMMILSALIFSGAMVIFKKVLEGYGEGETLFFQNGLGALIFLPFLIAELPGIPLAQTALGIVYGFSVGIVGFGLFFFALKRLSIFQYGALGYTEVFFGFLYGVILLGENFTLNIILGVVLILTSSVLSRFSGEKE